MRDALGFRPLSAQRHGFFPSLVPAGNLRAREIDTFPHPIVATPGQTEREMCPRQW
jgi:hypothetical protein